MLGAINYIYIFFVVSALATIVFSLILSGSPVALTMAARLLLQYLLAYLFLLMWLKNYHLKCAIN